MFHVKHNPAPDPTPREVRIKNAQLAFVAARKAEMQARDLNERRLAVELQRCALDTLTNAVLS